MIFVFGSNEQGIHGAGAAKYARIKRGAKWGQGFGPQGESFAIPTRKMSPTRRFVSLEIHQIRHYVNLFLAHVLGHPDQQFQVTRIGCGLAGYTDAEIAPLFREAPPNCHFDEKWEPILGPEKIYWGSF